MQTTSSPLIEFRNVRKAFGSHQVYKDLSLNVSKGESVTIIGGSGQGKSVMLKMLIGLLTVDGGQIFFNQKEVTNLPETQYIPIRRRIGMLFQGAALFDSMSVKENVAYGIREHEKISEASIENRVLESLEHVGLKGVENMSPTDLSGGMKKRVGLARAIAVRPEVLLYDEPTTGLDPINVTRINRLILKLKDTLNITSVVVTHDMKSAFEISDRIIMINQGKVLQEGTADQIRDSSNPLVRNFIEGTAPETED